MLKPLAGVKVIEIGQALAGPLAGVVLADMGADVVKIEKPMAAMTPAAGARPSPATPRFISTARTATSAPSRWTSNAPKTSRRWKDSPPARIS